MTSMYGVSFSDLLELTRGVGPGGPLGKAKKGIDSMEPMSVSLNRRFDDQNTTLEDPYALLTQNALLAHQNAELLKERARLEKKNAIMQQNAVLALENTRLAQENARLTMEQKQRARLPKETDDQSMRPPPGLLLGVAEMSPSKVFMKKYGSVLAWGSGFDKPTASPTGSFASTVSTRVSTQASFSNSSVASDEVQENVPIAPRTSVMMRRLPIEMTRDMLVDLVFNMGFQSSCDLVYLPMDFKTRTNLGYAFVNLNSNEKALEFQAKFHGFKDWVTTSDRVCEVTWGDALQGLDAHVERYKNSPVLHESIPDIFKPLLFANGQRIPFPQPSKKIRVPRQWARR